MPFARLTHCLQLLLMLVNSAVHCYNKALSMHRKVGGEFLHDVNAINTEVARVRYHTELHIITYISRNERSKVRIIYSRFANHRIIPYTFPYQCMG